MSKSGVPRTRSTPARAMPRTAGARTTRSTPTTKPSITASRHPAIETRAVLRRPAAMTRATLSPGLTRIHGVSPMAKFAGSRRKSNPSAMPRWSRLARVFRAIHQPAAAITPRQTAWTSLSEWWRVEQPTVGPEAIESALHVEGGLRPEMAVEDVAVVPDGGNDMLGSPRVEAVSICGAGIDSEEAPDRRIATRVELGDVLSAEPQLLGLDGRPEDPVHDFQPPVIAIADKRRDRLLRDA